MESLVNASPIAMYTCKAGGDFRPPSSPKASARCGATSPRISCAIPASGATASIRRTRRTCFEQLARVLERSNHSYDYRFRTKSGEYRWTHDELRLVTDAAGNPLEIAGYCFDITEQKLAEAALRESEERLKVIFNSTSDLQALFRVEAGRRLRDRGRQSRHGGKLPVENGQERGGLPGKRL